MTRDASDHLETKDNIKRILRLISIAMAIFAFIVIGVVVFLTYSANELEIEANNIIVTGHMGTELAIADIETVELHQVIPKINRKVGGSSVFNRKKGQFLLEDLGRGRLYVHLNKPPFIYIKTSENYIFINSKDSTTTQEWYKVLNQKINE
ncbi:hypothetical protein [Alkalihalobacterium elongatum]|uniref:hypothetical protein n=1 Tax=Alkalihalobacterium elongatum TaxID=2675466 RepID=UPI001C1F740D|nr:hypothetical protein [Alkalihalobacterium elongatum]